MYEHEPDDITFSTLNIYHFPPSCPAPAYLDVDLRVLSVCRPGREAESARVARLDR